MSDPLLCASHLLPMSMPISATLLGIGRRSSAAAKRKAIEQVQGWVEFTPQGVVLDASDSFLRVVGYERRELIGRHHRTLCDPASRSSAPTVASARGDARSGSRGRTIRCSTPRAQRTGS